MDHMTPLLPLNPIVCGELLALDVGWMVWSAHGSLLLDEPAEWLRLADGTRRVGQVLQAAPDKPRALAVLHALARAALLSEGDAQPTDRIAVVGHGRLAQDLCTALARYQIDLVLAGPARPGAFVGVRPPWDPSATPAAIASVHHVEHWSQLSRDRVDLVAVAAETCEPDRAITHHLSGQQVPHVVVRAHRDVATVGPVWTAPDQACTSCIDLAIGDRDSSWGRVVMALCEREADPDASTSLAAAALAVMRLRSATNHASRWDDVTVVHSQGIDQQRWPPHPQCRCHQPGVTAGTGGRSPHSGGRAGGPLVSEDAAA